MGLTSASTGAGAVDHGLTILKNSPDDRVVALAGNPNTGKSTVFNYLTGLRQHTGYRAYGEVPAGGGAPAAIPVRDRL